MGKDRIAAHFYNEDWDGSGKPGLSLLQLRYAWCLLMRRISPKRSEYAHRAAELRAAIDEARKIRAIHRISQD